MSRKTFVNYLGYEFLAQDAGTRLSVTLNGPRSLCKIERIIWSLQIDIVH